MKKHTVHSQAHITHTKKVDSIVSLATDAAIELGIAAEGLKELWKHVQKAQAKGTQAAAPLVRGGKKMLSKARKMVSKKK